MKIGCPKEIKNNEYRVGMTPAAARAYVEAGHEVYVERGAGIGSGIEDSEYEKVGAKILQSAKEIWDLCEMIVKVKEPLPSEYDLMRDSQILYTYFHLAADEKLTRACIEKKIIAIAYETVQESDGSLPLLKPMSEVAGRMAPLMGAYFLGKPRGGRGILATGVPGVFPANVLIIGGGTVGTNAAKTAAGLGANVTVLDINVNTLEHLENILPPNVFTQFSNAHNLEIALKKADMVVGAVLIPGAKAPKLITKEHLKIMKPGAVIVDVSIDQGGCAETSKPTTHSEPTFVIDGVVHYCVANMPGAYARTSTFALNHATIRYGLEIANKGVKKACLDNPAICKGLNVVKGKLTCEPVARAFSMNNICISPEGAIDLL